MPLAFDAVLRFSNIRIVESLPPGELRTGERLVARTLDPIARRQGNLTVALARAQTRDEFLHELQIIADDVERTGMRPILHLEAHGADNGLRLGSGQFLEWEELREHLTRINLATGLHLLVVMAMCSGWHLSRLLVPGFRAPAWAILGPTVDVVSGDLLEAMESFYGRLIQCKDANSGLRAMNEHRPVGGYYALEFAAEMFCASYNRYLAKESSAPAGESQENVVIAEARRLSGDRHTSDAEVRAFVRTVSADQTAFFESAKETFFMFDVHHQNRARFPFAASDCGYSTSSGAPAAV